MPKNLNESMESIANEMSNRDLTTFKNMTEDSATSEFHMSTGLWIRNNWIRGNRDSSLVNYFHKLGVFNPDDISNIILTSLHRKLNNKSIDLQSQVDFYKAYWEPFVKREKAEMKRELEIFNRFKKLDSITILMHINRYKNELDAELDFENIDWAFNPNLDLKINGIIVSKYVVDDTVNIFFKILIRSLNNDSTTIFKHKFKNGDILDVPLRGMKLL